ncbi:OLC1v1024733C1 [Oldenlandia corymbosa var. corymbosa]|nr:OLC1v1024733C1 [Oldenlandia corymbosa var. corymbosa]
MMEDLVAMHKETRLFYGPEGPSPEWLKWDAIELLPTALKEILIGRDGGDLGGWMPLYSAADVSKCMQRVQSLKYAEEACYNGILLLKAFSSGLDIGTCNWSITSPKQNVAYISGSVFASEISTKFDYHALWGSDVIFFSDCIAADLIHKDEVDFTSPGAAAELPSNLSEEPDAGERISEFLLNHDEFADESKKLTFLCSWALKSTNAGGSVLIPISRLGLVLQLLEHLTFSLQSQALKVPIYIISSVAEELHAFLKVMPEWLCKQRQEKFHSDQGYFSFMDLIEQKRLFLFPEIYSSELLAIWEEPCIVFSPHWSLRIGPSVHLLQRWCGETDSLLIIEEGVDANLACLPFQPMAMKVLHCSFPSGMKLREAEYFLQFLNPKYVLMPEKLKQDIRWSNHSYSLIYYHESETLHIPRVKSGTDVDCKIYLDFQLCSTKMGQEDINIATANGDFSVIQGKIQLGIGHEQILRSRTTPLICMGCVDLQSLVTSLQKLGMNTRVEEVMSLHGSESTSFVHVVEPKKALLQLTSAHTIIIANDESLASVLTEAVQSILDCI